MISETFRWWLVVEGAGLLALPLALLLFQRLPGRRPPARPPEPFRGWLGGAGAGPPPLPIALLLFQRLPGRGYAFAKPVGLLLGAYLFWLPLPPPVLPTPPRRLVW